MSKVNFTQDYLIYSPKREGIYPLPESDWQRLKGLIGMIIPERKIYNFIASLSFGVFVSSIFSLVTLYTANGLAVWIIPTNWSILVCSFILGIALLLLDEQQRTLITISKNLIIGEMDSLEKKYIKAQDSET